MTFKPSPVLALCAVVVALSGCKKETTPEAAPSAAAASTAAAPASAPATAAPALLTPGAYDKVLRIESSDPSVTVTGVFLDGRPMKTAGLGTTSVQALLVADPDEGNGTPCASEGMEIRLANAIIARPLINFCATNYVLHVAAAKPALSQPLPALPEDFSWQIDGRGDDKMIYLGIPETDMTAMLATCRKGETRAQVRFFQEAGPTPTVDIYGPDRMLRYALKRTSTGSSEEAPTNEVDLSVDDQLFAMLGSGKRLAYRIEKGDILSLDPAQGVEKISQFVAWCSGP